MPTKDLTSRVSEHSQELLKRVMMRVRQRVFLGPGIEELTRKEAIQRLQGMNPEQLASLVKGPQRDQVMDEMESLLEGGKHARRTS